MTPEVKERIEQIRNGNVPKGYRKCDCGIIPNDWHVAPLSAVVHNEIRVMPKPKEPYWRVGVRSWAKGTFRAFVDDPSTVDMDELYVVKENDLIVNITFAWEQAIALAQKEDDGLLVSHRFPTYVFDGENVPDYYKAVFTQKRYKYLLEIISPGGAGRNRVLDRKEFLKLSVPVPSNYEQRRIAEIIAAQDKVIELQEKLLEEKQWQKKYLMQQLLTGKKRLPGFVGKWEHVELGQISQKQKQKNKAFAYSLVLSNSAQHGILPQSEQFDKEIANDENINGYYIVHDGFFVYNPRISVTAPCGPINRNETGKTGVMSPLYTVFSIKSERVNCDFLKQYFSSSCWYRHMKSVANYGARHDRMNVSDEDFFLMPIPIPSMDEQTAIAQVLNVADKEIELLRQSIEQEKQKKKALMQLLLTGLVRVQS